MFTPETYWDAVDRAENMAKVRASLTVGSILSWEMIRLLATVIFEGYEIGGPARE